MTDKANHQANLKQARELLSPYLDDEVTAAERALVEQMVEQSPELRRDLETLRQTVAQLSALPSLAAPRPFTLSEADVPPAEPSIPWWNIFSQPWLGALAGAAVALLCVVIAGALFFGGAFGIGSSAPVADVAMQEEAAPAEKEPAAEEAAPAEAEAPAADTALEAAKQPASTQRPPEAQALEAPAEEDAVEEMTVESAPAEEVAEEEAVVVEEETIGEIEGEAVEEEAAEVERFAAEEAEESADEMAGAAMAESAAEADIAPTPSPLATSAPAPEEPVTDGEAPQPAPAEPVVQATEPPVETTDQAQAQRQEVVPPATTTPLPSPTRPAPTETVETIAPDQGGDEAPSLPFPRSVVVLVGLVAVVIIAGLLLWGIRRRG